MSVLNRNLHSQIQKVKHKLNDVEKNIILCYPSTKRDSNILLENCLVKTQMAKKVCDKILNTNRIDCGTELTELKSLLKVIHKSTSEMTSGSVGYDTEE